MSSSVFITGAASGIGRATALYYARQGWYVGAEAGINWIADNDFTFDTSGIYDAKAFSAINKIGGNNGTVDFDAGWAGLVTVGYGKSKLKDPSQPMAEVNRRVQVVNMENKATAANASK